MKPFDPRSTVFTNLALDEIMPSISPNAWKILCLAIRKTAGWSDISTKSQRKESDMISISQFRKGCGISSNDTVMKAISECLDKGYLIRKKQGQSFRYYVNTDYEIPTVTESVIPTVTESVTVTVTESVNTNSNVNYKVNARAESKLAPAKKNGDQMDKEEYLASVKESLDKSFSNPLLGYANYPERLRPIVERMEKYWYFRAPTSKKSNGKFAFWIEGCEDVLDACAEIGLSVIDNLHDDWVAYMNENGGCAPFTVSSPKSLANSVAAKAALMRSGSNAPLWKLRNPTSQSRLDV